MNDIFPLNQLEIIGYREVPVREPAMPRLLSSIFAVQGADTVLFPPYTLGEQEVIGPVVSTREEFDDLVAREEVSRYSAVQAWAGHELWLDDKGIINYGPEHVARNNLAEIFKTRCGMAEQALKTGSWSEARTHAMVAYSANPRSLDPLSYRAAAEHLMASRHSAPEQLRAELALTEIIAKSHLSIPAFRMLYLDVAKMASPLPSPKLVPTA